MTGGENGGRKRMPTAFVRELPSFIFVGMCAAGLYALIASRFSAIFGWRPWIASVLAYMLVVPAAYFVQKTLAFRSQALHRHAFPKYFAVQITGIALSIPLSEGALRVLALEPLTGFALVGAVIALSNYVLLKVWAFVAS